MYFKNIKEAHSYYKFPGSYQYGSVYIKDYGIIRSYSNGAAGKDFFKGKIFNYKIKNQSYYLKFLENKRKNNSIRLFVKENGLVKDYGLCKLVKLTKEYVSLKINS